jgi:NADPH2:quinone reductase
MGGGAMAEETVANAASVFPVPDGVTLAQAAAFPVAFGTAHLALTRYARVTKGSTVLILGAAGGVGLAAVQIAKALGCVVVAAANGVRKMDALTRRGSGPLHRRVAPALRRRWRDTRGAAGRLRGA